MKKLLASSTILTLMMSVTPALAYGGGYPPIGNDIQVTNFNNATVTNNVMVVASTGNNTANGDDGGDAKAKVFGNGTATVGNGGAGGDGGTIVTGDAYAKAKVVNVVNTNRTKVNACACCECAEPCECIDDSIVKNMNMADVNNGVDVLALTDENTANGDDGGDAKAKVFSFSGGSATAGNGGSGGDGGTIVTGDAYAKAKVVNVVNKNVTRIRR